MREWRDWKQTKGYDTTSCDYQSGDDVRTDLFVSDLYAQVELKHFHVGL